MRLVVSLSGAVIADAVETDTLDTYVDALSTVADEVDTLIVVTGAGALKRYIDALDGFAVSEARKDMVGIAATRLQASTLAAALDANVAIPETLERVPELAQHRDVIVLGGLLPGQSTDGVAAECAELIGADRVVIATTVDGVYDGDPNDTAVDERHDTLTFAELAAIVDGDTAAGSYPLIDGTAITLLQRSAIETVVLDGTDPAVLRQAVDEAPDGTVIRDA